MSIRLTEENGGQLLAVHVSGSLIKDYYTAFVSAFERLLQQHAKLRVLFDMSEFAGWELSATWDDATFAIHPFADIERLAQIGDTKCQHGMAVFCKPFVKAQVRYFAHTKAAEARKWLSGG